MSSLIADTKSKAPSSNSLGDTSSVAKPVAVDNSQPSGETSPNVTPDTAKFLQAWYYYEGDLDGQPTWKSIAIKSVDDIYAIANYAYDTWNPHIQRYEIWYLDAKKDPIELADQRDD